MGEFALFRVNLVEKLQIDLVCDILGVRMALEGHLGRLNVEFHVLFGDIGDGESEVNNVTSGVGFGATLSPEDYIRVRLELHGEIATALSTVSNMQSVGVGGGSLTFRSQGGFWHGEASMRTMRRGE